MGLIGLMGFVLGSLGFHGVPWVYMGVSGSIEIHGVRGGYGSYIGFYRVPQGDRDY